MASKKKPAPSKKKASAAAAAAEGGRRATRSGGPAANVSLSALAKPSSRKQKAPRRSVPDGDDVGAAAAAAAAAATAAPDNNRRSGGAAAAAGAGAGPSSRNNNNNNNADGGAGPSSSRPARDASGNANNGNNANNNNKQSTGKRKARFIPNAPRPVAAPLNVPKVSLKVDLSGLGGHFVGRRPLSMAVRADAALWDVRRQIDAHCRLMNNGLMPPEGARMAVRTIDHRGGDGGGGGGEGGPSGDSASAAAVEGPLLMLDTIDQSSGQETRLASYGLFPCPGGVYMLEMRRTKKMRDEEARRARKRAGGGGGGNGENDDDDLEGLGALGVTGGGAGAPRRGRGRPRSANGGSYNRRRASAPPIGDDGDRIKLESGSRKRIKWTADETVALITGVQKRGMGAWAEIRRDHLELFRANDRTDIDLKDRWRNLKTAVVRDGTVPNLAPELVATLRAAVNLDANK